MIVSPSDLGLTTKQDVFVRHFVEHGDRIAAVRAAGYRGDENVVAWRQFHTPTVMAALRYHTALRLQEGAPAALKVVWELMMDRETPRGIRLDAAKTWLDRSGHGAVRSDEKDSGGNEPLNEMSIDELRRMVDDLERRRGDQAVQILASPAHADEIEAIDPDEASPASTRRSELADVLG